MEEKDILSEIIEDEENLDFEVDIDKKMNLYQQKRYEEKHWFFKYRIKAIKRLLKGYILKKDCDILDIGVGTGTLSKYLEEFGNVMHIESDLDCINFNKDMSITHGLFPWNMTLPNKKFDYIVLLNIIEYNDSLKWFLDVCKSLLKPNGQIIITTLAGRELSKNDLMYKVKKKFSVDDFTKCLNEINMCVSYYTYFENLSIQEQLKGSLNKFFDEEEIYWNKIPSNNDEIYSFLTSKELPKLGINKISKGNQLFLIIENMSKEEIMNRSIKNNKRNNRTSFVDIAIDKFVEKFRKKED